MSLTSKLFGKKKSISEQMKELEKQESELNKEIEVQKKKEEIQNKLTAQKDRVAELKKQKSERSNFGKTKKFISKEAKVVGTGLGKGFASAIKEGSKYITVKNQNKPSRRTTKHKLKRTSKKKKSSSLEVGDSFI